MTQVRLFWLFCLLAMAAAFLRGPYPAGGWAWDLANGVGFAAMGGIAYLGWASRSLSSVHAQRFHSNIAIIVAVLVLAHGGIFLLMDTHTLEYLKLTAPVYMWSGVLGGLALLALAVSSFPRLRRRFYDRYAHFRAWHLGLSITALLLAAYHVLGADYYLDSGYAKGLFILVVAAAPTLAYLKRRNQRTPGSTHVTDSADADRQALAVVVGAVILAGIFSLLRNFG